MADIDNLPLGVLTQVPTSKSIKIADTIKNIIKIRGLEENVLESQLEFMCRDSKIATTNAATDAHSLAVTSNFTEDPLSQFRDLERGETVEVHDSVKRFSNIVNRQAKMYMTFYKGDNTELKTKRIIDCIVRTSDIVLKNLEDIEEDYEVDDEFGDEE